MKINKAYAGIGSRKISEEQKSIIEKVARTLSQDFTLYSGNADGADITFQIGAGKNSVAWIPWPKFNFNNYDASLLCGRVFAGPTNPGSRESVDKFHPAPHSLSQGARKLMERNYFQVMGDMLHPQVKFVLCCPVEYYRKNGKLVVSGGTSQAVRIAQHFNIPVICIGESGWEKELETVIDNL